MTRFQIVGVYDDKEVNSSGEFNGDGYFEGHGHEVCEMFKENTRLSDITRTINEDFGYDFERGLYGREFSELDFYEVANNDDYYNIWFSDYLYIKNYGSEDIDIRDENGRNITIHPGGWVTLNFGELLEGEYPEYEVKPNENVEIGLPQRLNLYVEDLNKAGINHIISEDPGTMILLMDYMQTRYKRIVEEFEWHLKGNYVVKITDIKWGDKEEE